MWYRILPLIITVAEAFVVSNLTTDHNGSRSLCSPEFIGCRAGVDALVHACQKGQVKVAVGQNSVLDPIWETLHQTQKSRKLIRKKAKINCRKHFSNHTLAASGTNNIILFLISAAGRSIYPPPPSFFFSSTFSTTPKLVKIKVMVEIKEMPDASGDIHN